MQLESKQIVQIMTPWKPEITDSKDTTTLLRIWGGGEGKTSEVVMEEADDTVISRNGMYVDEVGSVKPDWGQDAQVNCGAGGRVAAN